MDVQDKMLVVVSMATDDEVLTLYIMYSYRAVLGFREMLELRESQGSMDDWERE